MAQFTIASFPTVGKYYFEIPLKLSHVEIPMIVAFRTIMVWWLSQVLKSYNAWIWTIIIWYTASNTIAISKIRKYWWSIRYNWQFNNSWMVICRISLRNLQKFSTAKNWLFHRILHVDISQKWPSDYRFELF